MYNKHIYFIIKQARERGLFALHARCALNICYCCRCDANMTKYIFYLVFYPLPLPRHLLNEHRLRCAWKKVSLYTYLRKINKN